MDKTLKRKKKFEDLRILTFTIKRGKYTLGNYSSPLEYFGR